MYNVSKILSKIFRIDWSTLYIQHGTPICAPEILELLRLVRAIGSTCAVLFLAAPNIPTPYFTTSCFVVIITDRLFAQCCVSNRYKKSHQYDKISGSVPKGQLISKCLFGVIVSTKIASKIL